MAINVYAGLMGSGKSYEVVSSVIIPALQKGRRIVTNVYGLDEDKIQDYIIKITKGSVTNIGQIIHIDNTQIDELFFPTLDNDIHSIVKHGDLVAIDEAWRQWGSDKRLLEPHKMFFREHRHMVSPQTSFTCDLVLMTQDITDLHKYLKNVVEQTFVTAKHKRFGMNNHYRISVYEGSKLFKTKLVQTQQKKYNKAIFPLYNSYESEQATEAVIDDRQNIFKRKSLWVFASIILFLLVFSINNVIAYFSRHDQPKQVIKVDKKTTNPHQQSKPKPKKPETVFSTKWRIAGQLNKDNSKYVLLTDHNGNMRMESRSLFNGNGIQMAGKIDGEMVTYYTGQLEEEGIFR